MDNIIVFHQLMDKCVSFQTDGRLKDLRTASNQCQTLWVINQGFHKHCYINPGLFPKPVRDIAK